MGSVAQFWVVSRETRFLRSLRFFQVGCIFTTWFLEHFFFILLFFRRSRFRLVLCRLSSLVFRHLELEKRVCVFYEGNRGVQFFRLI